MCVCGGGEGGRGQGEGGVAIDFIHDGRFSILLTIQKMLEFNRESRLMFFSLSSTCNSY